MRKFLGFVLIVAVFVFQISYTQIFGGNFFPQSPLELGMDIMSLLVFLLGVYLSKSNRRLI
jgi:Mn2+/Fe2+ NRAMP family transporter